MRAVFLFNHDAAHQVAHLAPVAAAMTRLHPQVETIIAYANASIRSRIEGLLSSAGARNPSWCELTLPRGPAKGAAILDRILPASRLLRLRAHDHLLARSDVIVSTERTCLRMKDRLGSNAPLFVRVPHGTGDRSVTFHPDHRRFDMSLVAGPKMAKQLIANGVHPERIRETGYAKFEGIDLAAKPDPFGNGKPTFVYNPHFDPYLSSWYSAGPDLLRWFANEGGRDFNLIFAPHVMLFRKRLHISPEYRIARKRPDVPDEARAAPNILVDVDGPRLFDMSHMLAADAYIGDASSQLYEFLVRPRPVFILDPHGRLMSQGREALPFLATGPAAQSLSQLTDLLPNHAEIGMSYRAPQEHLMAHTFSLDGRPPSHRATDAIADMLSKKSVA